MDMELGQCFFYINGYDHTAFLVELVDHIDFQIEQSLDIQNKFPAGHDI